MGKDTNHRFRPYFPISRISVTINREISILKDFFCYTNKVSGTLIFTRLPLSKFSCLNFHKRENQGIVLQCFICPIFLIFHYFPTGNQEN
uniref:Uncharacterized protein n=1 Tax=Parietochloris pseudoalveolaris TaxID=3102 RepID=A0A097KLK2_9CHLO|nr:hypothetical protein [Parietochloris pseudoalveolaris]AIT94062.1 hypothetical protein [Parietochloris pseudoalveolaris]